MDEKVWSQVHAEKRDRGTSYHHMM
jgi:hypothetical protein